MTDDPEKPAPRRRPAPARREGEPSSRTSATKERPNKPPRESDQRREQKSPDGRGEETRRHRAVAKDRPRQGLSAIQLAQAALSSLRQLTTRDIEAVVGLSRKDNGNVVIVFEVVENHHFPDSSDLMAEYSVEVDPDGELVGYLRGDRYQRGRTGSNGS